MARRGTQSLRSLAAGAVVLAAALALTACSALSGLDRPPRITLVNLQPVQIQLIEQRYLATIRVQNPNPVELPINGLEYSIRINDSEFATGVSSQRVTVPAYGEKTLDLGVSSTIVKLFEQIRRFSTSDGSVKYRISGTLGLKGNATGVPFSQDGEIDLRLDKPTPSGQAA